MKRFKDTSRMGGKRAGAGRPVLDNALDYFHIGVRRNTIKRLGGDSKVRGLPEQFVKDISE